MTNSFEIFGKAWMLPSGHVIDCTGDEHARIARAYMLGISDDEMRRLLPLDQIHKPLTPEQADRYRDSGIPEDNIRFLMTGASVDPRIFAIREWDWIRTRENKFYAWEWDEKTLLRVILNDDFWKRTQVKNDTWLDFIAISDGDETQNTYGKLRAPYIVEAA